MFSKPARPVDVTRRIAVAPEEEDYIVRSGGRHLWSRTVPRLKGGVMGRVSAAIQPHNQKPASVWNSGGAGYEEVSRGIADSIEHAVLRLSPQPGERILDLATGTGWTSRRVVLRGAKVVGVDLGEDLIRAAQERASAEELDIEYRVADAESLPFEDGEFDAVISTCGIMFASRPEAAGSELARVTRKEVMKSYMAPPPDPAPLSPFEWGRPERVRQLLGKDFDLKFERGTSFYREPSGEAAWQTFSMNYGPTKALASSLDESRRADLRRDFIAFHEGFRTELGICVPREYLLTVGIRR
jgi:SAM-dependent methyltransferase